MGSIIHSIIPVTSTIGSNIARDYVSHFETLHGPVVPRQADTVVQRRDTFGTPATFGAMPRASPPPSPSILSDPAVILC
jgi:hypothetical protein